MIEEIDEDEIVDMNIGFAGHAVEPKNDLIALIDADTIAFIACLGAEEINMLLPRSFYTDEEWEEIVNNPTYKEDADEYYTIDIPTAIERCVEKIDKIKERTGCQEVELHFSSGRKNFRYTLYPEYKANRTERPPVGLKEVKVKLSEMYNSYTHTKWEADDMVVCKKREDAEKYLLCAIDKDVLYALPGRHFNYFEANYYVDTTHVLRDMEFIEVTEDHAKYWSYLQVIDGDKSDNIKGPKRIGPQTMIPFFGGTKPKPAIKKLPEVMKHVPAGLTHKELWKACVDAYEAKGLTEDDAVLNMNLVNMHMLQSDSLGSLPDRRCLVKENGYEIIEWRPYEL